MALGSTQPLVKMSTRNVPGDKGGRCVRLTTYHHTVPYSRNLWALTLLDPSGPHGLLWECITITITTIPITLLALIVEKHSVEHGYPLIAQFTCKVSWKSVKHFKSWDVAKTESKAIRTTRFSGYQYDVTHSFTYIKKYMYLAHEIIKMQPPSTFEKK